MNATPIVSLDGARATWLSNEVLLAEIDPGNTIVLPATDVYRVRTSVYKSGNSIHVHKEIRLMVRLSKRGFALLMEDAANIGADEVVPHIVNLNEVEDGLYTVATLNEKRDGETGYVEEYDYKLIPYKETPR